MKTGTGVEIRDVDLTHQFVWGGKTCLIGKFDPSDYPNTYSYDWEIFVKHHSQDIFDQLEDSEVFTNQEQGEISEICSCEFLKCISLRVQPTQKNLNHAEAFREARKYVVDGSQRYICFSLVAASDAEIISYDKSSAAQTLIGNRLGSHCYLEDFLVAKVPSLTYDYLRSDEGREQMQLYRLRWLDALIAEFS